MTNWTLTGAANPADMTGGRRTVVFAEKTPDLRGATLTAAWRSASATVTCASSGRAARCR